MSDEPAVNGSGTVVRRRTTPGIQSRFTSTEYDPTAAAAAG